MTTNRHTLHPRHRWLFFPGLLLLLSLVLLRLANPAPVQGHAPIAPRPSSVTQQVVAPSRFDSAVVAEESLPRSFTTISDTVEISVTLGMDTSVSISITNNTSGTRTPTLYEARPTPPLGVVDPVSPTMQTGSTSLAALAPRIDPQLQQELAESPTERHDFLVLLHDQPDLSAAYTMTDWAERGWYVYQTLSNHAQQSQQSLRTWLDEEGTPYHSLWIINALVVNGTERDMERLAARADVAMLRANHTVSLDDDPQIAIVANCIPNSNNVCWNIETIGADEVWYDFGVSGEGITVANVDSGVRYDHPALVEQYRGYRGARNFRHSYNWYDPVNESVIPADTNGHGTHTLGTMVARGDGSADQPAVGVAPGASWIAARGCSTAICNETDIIIAAEWLLSPTDPSGENPRPDLRPHVVNNSWASSEGGNPIYTEFIESWRAAGIFPVFVNGNAKGGAVCGSVASPGDYANVFSVGATDRGDMLARYSKLGPSLDGVLKPDLTAPGDSISSTSNNSGLSYKTLSGTSMAAPHVAGAVALLWSANPDLIGDYTTTYALLTQNALPLTESSQQATEDARCLATTTPNNLYGYGRLDIYNAVKQAKVDVPWLQVSSRLDAIAPGASETLEITVDASTFSQSGIYRARLLVSSGNLSETPLSIPIVVAVNADPNNTALVQGYVYDETTNAPLNATVQAADGPNVSVDKTGKFSITLPTHSDAYTPTITARAMGYVGETRTVSITAGAEHNLTFHLVPDSPRIQTNDTPIHVTLNPNQRTTRTVTFANTGTLPMDYTLTIPPERYSVQRSDIDGDGVTTEWVDMPPSATRVTLKDDTISEPIPIGFSFPISNTFYAELRINANGVLVLGEPLKTNGFRSRCPPEPVAETNGVALMPFRADLDPSAGGRVSYAQMPQGFVVSFEQVPLFQKLSRTFTFQALLKPNGDIYFNYRALSDIPGNAMAGIQIAANEVQNIGCGEELSLHNFLTLHMQKQPLSTTWAILEAEKDGLLAPNQEQRAAIVLQWAAPGPRTEPYRSSVTIESNDVRTPTVEIPIELRARPPSHSLALPTIRVRD